MTLANDFLSAAGLGALPETVKPQYLRHCHEELQHAVGSRLANDMSEEQLDEFQALADGPPKVALAWLHINFPHYPHVVREEITALRSRLTLQAPELLALELAFHAGSTGNGHQTSTTTS